MEHGGEIRLATRKGGFACRLELPVALVVSEPDSIEFSRMPAVTARSKLGFVTPRALADAMAARARRVALADQRHDQRGRTKTRAFNIRADLHLS